MYLSIIILCNFIAGAAIVHFIHDALPEYWEWAFRKYSTLEADQMQDIWYENERLIYFVIFLFGYVFMFLFLFAFVYGRIKKLINRK